MHPEIAEARKQKEKKQGANLTVREACDLWIDRTRREFSRSLVDQYRSLSNMLCRWATAHGIVYVQDITALQLEKWYSSTAWEEFAETTRSQKWSVLRTMFNWWLERKVILESPIKCIKATKLKSGHVQGPYSEEQMTAILAAIRIPTGGHTRGAIPSARPTPSAPKTSGTPPSTRANTLNRSAPPTL